MQRSPELASAPPLILQATELLSYEFVFTSQDFLVAINGACLPSECTGYSVDRNRCFVLHQRVDEFVSLPIPEVFAELVAQADEIVFVQFVEGLVADANVLPRVNLNS